jgi:tetratricopeptide (TPR) repeat protein
MRTRPLAPLFLLALVAAAPAWAGWEEGVAAFKGGNFAQAVKEFQSVVQQKPDWPGGHLMLGRSLLKLGRPEEAVAALRKSYDLNPGDVSGQLALAEAYMAARRYNDASQLLGKINPASLAKEAQGVYHQLHAAALAKSGQSDQATAALERAARANPGDVNAQFAYGAAALNAGDTASAAAALERAARLAPNDSAKQRVYIQALLRQGRESAGAAKSQAYAKAGEAAKALASRQATYDHLLLLGEAQLGGGNYAGAAATFEQAVGKNPNDWLPHYYHGQALTVTQNYAGAEAALRRAMTKTDNAKNQTLVWKQIGFVNEKTKNFAEAKTAYQRAGDSAAVARVEENERIARENASIETENARLKELEKERAELEKQLKELSGKPPL